MSNHKKKRSSASVAAVREGERACRALKTREAHERGKVSGGAGPNSLSPSTADFAPFTVYMNEPFAPLAVIMLQEPIHSSFLFMCVQPNFNLVVHNKIIIRVE